VLQLSVKSTPVIIRGKSPEIVTIPLPISSFAELKKDSESYWFTPVEPGFLMPFMMKENGEELEAVNTPGTLMLDEDARIQAKEPKPLLQVGD
jgi:hypothetical protein